MEKNTNNEFGSENTTEEEDLINFNDSSDPVVEAEKLEDVSVTPDLSVTEKVIFCLDSFALVNSSDGGPVVNHIFHALRAYLNLKKRISVKPVEFHCLLLTGNNEIIHAPLNQAKDFCSALMLLKDPAPTSEGEPFNFEKLFIKLAQLVDFADSNFHSDALPPPCVYHAILLFGRNLFIPKMKSTNAFDFLMKSSYFALDILYLYDSLMKNQHCEQIAKALLCLNENNKGYFFSALKADVLKHYSHLMQFLGHPLIRFPQNRAKFDIKELGPQELNDEDIEH